MTTKGYRAIGSDTDHSDTKVDPRGHHPDPRELRKLAVDDWPIDMYRPMRHTNWTRDPIKYNPSQDELMFIDRTLCQLVGGASALVAALYGLITLALYPWWVVLLFAISTWGLLIGCIWDLYNECVPVNRWYFPVKSYRSLNAAFASIFCVNNLMFHVTADYNYIAKSVSLEAWYFVNIMAATYVGFAALLGHHRGPGPALTALCFPVLTQFIILITAKANGLPELNSPVAFSGWILLLGVPVLECIGLLLAVRLALYHAIMCVSLFMMNFALQSWGPGFCEQTRYGTKAPNIWFCFLGFVIGIGLVFFKQPLQREGVRRISLNSLWFGIWSRILHTPAWDPTQLDLRRNKNQPFLGTKAWWLGSRVDPRTGFRLADDLSIPRPEFVPVSQQFHVDGAPVQPFFGVDGTAKDARFPHSDVRTALNKKLRFTHGQDGSYWYSSIFAISGPAPCPTASIVQAKYQGTLLEFLTWFGHLSPMLRKVDANDEQIFGDLEGATHVLDMEWMSAFDVKKDFHRCGGRAFFRLEKTNTRLHVVFLTKPLETQKIYPLRLYSGETDWQFDQAEQIILMSSHALVTVGYHHAGIHVMMSLVGVALHNGFDTNDGDFFHPWRTAMNLHFFNHIAVTDLLIGPLMEHHGILPQMFPFTRRAFSDFVQHVVDNCDFMAHADLETRKAVVDGFIPEMGTLNCESTFKDIYRHYAQMIADVCWKTDKDVVNDSQMQTFIRNLDSNIPKGLPARFKTGPSAKFTTKAQVVEFTASAIQMVTVRHEIDGSLFWRAAFEPYVMQSKLPLDFGPPSVADFQAMIGFVIATSRKMAPKLMVRTSPLAGEKTSVGYPKNPQGAIMNDFKYLIRALPEEDVQGTRNAYENLQGALHALFVDACGTREKRDKATWFLNVTPEMLEVGAGY